MYSSTLFSSFVLSVGGGVGKVFNVNQNSLRLLTVAVYTSFQNACLGFDIYLFFKEKMTNFVQAWHLIVKTKTECTLRADLKKETTIN